MLLKFVHNFFFFCAVGYVKINEIQLNLTIKNNFYVILIVNDNLERPPACFSIN